MSEHGHSMDDAQTNEYDDSMDEESEFANPDDFKVKRGSDGEVLPLVKNTELGKVKVVPMSYGDVERYFGESNVADIDSSQVAKLLNDHLVRPNLKQDAGGRITADYVEGMKPLAPRELLFAIMDASGIDADVEMDDEGGAEVTVGN